MLRKCPEMVFLRLHPFLGVIDDIGPPPQGDTYHGCVAKIKMIQYAKFCPYVPKMLEPP